MDVLKSLDTRSKRPLFESEELGLQGGRRVHSRGQSWTEPGFWLGFLMVGTPFTIMSLLGVIRAREPHHVFAALAYFTFSGSWPVLWGAIFLWRTRIRKFREGASVLHFDAPEKFQAGPLRMEIEIPARIERWSEGDALLVATAPSHGAFVHLEPGEEFSLEWATHFAIPDARLFHEGEKTRIKLEVDLPEDIETVPPSYSFRIQVRARVKGPSFDATFELPTRDQARRGA